ncbi:RAMP superfamily CRISPR-associated protein, partial [Nocardiopsis sp. MG754419]|uniref:RAMP superfamily CRISPR-associated protein n=1 Tax=Nocardiopsis sp. MG754419 TaxID=2259865 RepID=UPI001BAD4EA1
MNRDLDAPRPPALVWEFATRLCLLGDAHIGAARATPRHAAESDVDLTLDRDPLDGRPRLRATTLAGLLRHELLARTDPVAAAALFGTEDGYATGGSAGPAPVTSALDLDDARAVLPDDLAVTVRVGTRVDPATGAVFPGRLWQWEVLPAGTVFTCHLRLRVPAPADEARLLALLLIAARGLDGDGPGIRVGARTGRGHGAVRATHWSASRYDLTDPDAWFGFHARTWETRRLQGAEALAGPPQALASLVRNRLGEHGHTAVAAHVGARSAVPDPRRRAELRLEIRVAERTDPFESAPCAPDLQGAEHEPDRLRPAALMIGDVPEADRLADVDRAHRWRPTVTDDGRVHPRPVLGDTALFALFKRIGGRLVRDAAEHLGGPPERWRAWHGHWWGADPASPGPG